MLIYCILSSWKVLLKYERSLMSSNNTPYRFLVCILHGRKGKTMLYYWIWNDLNEIVYFRFHSVPHTQIYICFEKNVFHTGTFLGYKISISPKNQFLKETMETNLSASLCQPHKASTEKPPSLRSTLLASRGGSEGAAPALIEVGGCIHSCTFSKFLRVNMHLWSEGCLGALLCPDCVGFCWEMYTGKINGQGIRGKCAQHCPALQPTTQLGSSWMASIIELKAV